MRNVVTWAAIVLTAFGCSSTQLMNKELARVAKDWSLVIRASQVIPVYPLTEDLQPGDVLLVRTPIEEQVKEYNEKGFLPLDQLLVRLNPEKGYTEFYKGGYRVGPGAIPPRVWQFPNADESVNQWGFAPRAGFPTYRFSVRSGAGINLAVPVQGVPVGLGLMGAGSATGTITIADAYTYGLDDFWLRGQVENWVNKNTNYLRQFEPQNGREHYLRVVSRVFLTGRVNITLNSDEAFGGTLSVGAPKPVSLQELKPDETAQNYARMIGALNNALEKALPGGTVKVAAASSRSISLVESFPRPLVIGYLAFDLPIKKHGRVGAPVPTQSKLTGMRTLPTTTTWGPDANSNKISEWLKKDPENRQRLGDWLEQQRYERRLIPNIVVSDEYAGLREVIVHRFNIP